MKTNGHPTRTRTSTGDLGNQVATSIGTLLAVAAIAFVAAAPFTWLLMLFLGNVGVAEAGFWDCLPGGVLIGALVAGRGKG